MSSDVPMTLSPDRRVALFVTPDNNHVAIWRLGSPVSAIRKVTVGNQLISLVACGPDTACALTAQHQLVRIAVAAAFVERRVALAPDIGDTLMASRRRPDAGPRPVTTASFASSTP